MYRLSVSIHRLSLAKLQRIVLQFNWKAAFAQAFTSEGKNTGIVSCGAMAAIIPQNPNFFFFFGSYYLSSCSGILMSWFSTEVTKQSLIHSVTKSLFLKLINVFQKLLRVQCVATKLTKKKYVVAKQMGQTCLPPLQWNYRLCWGQTKSSFFCQLDYLQAQVCSQT